VETSRSVHPTAVRAAGSSPTETRTPRWPGSGPGRPVVGQWEWGANPLWW